MSKKLSPINPRLYDLFIETAQLIFEKYRSSKPSVVEYIKLTNDSCDTIQELDYIQELYDHKDKLLKEGCFSGIIEVLLDDPKVVCQTMRGISDYIDKKKDRENAKKTFAFTVIGFFNNNFKAFSVPQLNKEMISLNYINFEKYLYSDTYGFRFLALLYNFRSESKHIKINDQLSIQSVSDRDRETLLPTRESGGMRMWDLIKQTHMMVFEVYVDKKEPLPGPFHDFNLLLTALRLIKSGPVDIESVTHYPIGGLQEGGYTESWGHIATADPFNKYQFLSTDTKELLNLWNLLSDSNRQNLKTIIFSLSRFNRSYHLKDFESKLVDHMICLESIYLSGVGDSKTRGELRYRLSLRIGCFLSNNQEKRYEIMKEIQEGYDLRSQIVHSGYIESKNKKVNLKKITTRIEEHLRNSFIKMLKINKPEIDFEKYILNIKS